MTDPVWTVDEAAQFFTAAGIPMTPEQLGGIIARLPKFPRKGRARSGPAGGVGKVTYPVADLMRLNAALAEWLVLTPGPPGYMAPGRPGWAVPRHARGRAVHGRIEQDQPGTSV